MIIFFWWYFLSLASIHIMTLHNRNLSFISSSYIKTSFVLTISHGNTIFLINHQFNDILHYNSFIWLFIIVYIILKTRGVWASTSRNFLLNMVSRPRVTQGSKSATIVSDQISPEEEEKKSIFKRDIQKGEGGTFDSKI